MYRLRALLPAAVIAAACLVSSLAQAAPLAAYGKLPRVEDAQISPDGSMIAYSLTDGENRLVLVRETDGHKIVAGARAGDAKIREVRWGGPKHLIITTTVTSAPQDIMGPRREWWISQTLDITNGKQRGLLDKATGSMNTILGLPDIVMIDGEPAAIVPGYNFVDNRGRVGLFRVKLATGQTRMIEGGELNTEDWAVGPDGTALAQTEYDERTGAWRLQIKRNGAWTIVERDSVMLGRPSLLGMGRNERSILVSFPQEEGDPILKEYAVDGGKPVTVIDTSFDWLIRDPATQRLIGYAVLVGDETRYTFYDPKAEAIWKGVMKAYPEDRVRLVSWSADRRRIIVEVDSAEVGPAYALVDLDKKAAEWLGETYADIKAADISAVRPVTYKAADGLEIHGYLTLPRGKEAKGLPLVVLPHGGPAARDEPGFDWWSQALASRGYAVLRPNFRGSDGYGRDFLEAGYGEWGGKMQSDLSDGVRHLAKEGVIDPKRVCIAGASYGGYAALAGVTMEKGVYRCAVSIAGPSDLRRMLDEVVARVGRSQHSSLRYWQRFMGVDGRKDPNLAATSPAKLAAQADAPVLLIHGKDDTVVLYTQSDVMRDALKRAGKPVELVTLKGEDHWLSRGDTRLQMLTVMVDFLEKHNPPN